MIFYHISSLIKIIIGTLIIYYLFTSINVYQEPIFALPAGFLGLFFVIWGLFFFIFYVVQKIFSSKNNISIASGSYKTSLLFALYIIVNISLIIMEKWDKLIGIGILLAFIVLQMLIINHNEHK